jgi:hypothetical protein
MFIYCHTRDHSVAYEFLQFSLLRLLQRCTSAALLPPTQMSRFYRDTPAITLHPVYSRRVQHHVGTALLINYGKWLHVQEIISLIYYPVTGRGLHRATVHDRQILELLIYRELRDRILFSFPRLAVHGYTNMSDAHSVRFSVTWIGVIITICRPPLGLAPSLAYTR